MVQERIAVSREGTKAKAEQLLSFVRKSVVGPQQSLYPFLRLVLPVNDVERGKIGLKQSSLARTYINALHLDKKTSTAAMQLIFFKDPAKRNAAIHSSSSASSSAAVQVRRTDGRVRTRAMAAYLMYGCCCRWVGTSPTCWRTC